MRSRPPPPTHSATGPSLQARPRTLDDVLHPSIDPSLEGDDDGDDDGDEDATNVDATVGARGQQAASEPEGSVTEFRRSLDAPLKSDMLYRRVVATADQALRYHRDFEAAHPSVPGATTEALYGKLRIVVELRALEKMHGWVTDRSAQFTLEVQGRFLARRRPDHILVDDFLPLPSFCQSLAYETQGPEDRKQRFGNAKMRTISPDDWKPHETRVYQQLGVFSATRDIVFDPLKVQIPFHSHYTRSLYQEGPSPGDTDHLHHIKWLYAPVTGLNVIYSGVTPFQVLLPHRFTPVTVLDDREAAHNPADCRAELDINGTPLSVRIPLDEEGLVIGRDAEASLAVPDASLSRRHARVFFNDDGLLMLEDLGSKNGTVMDGKPVREATPVRRPTRVRMGDVDVHLRF